MRNTAVRYRINKMRVARNILFLLTVGVIMSMIIYGATQDSYTAYAKEVSDSYAIIEVCEGDTLWTIAKAYSGENASTRNSVYAICEANNLQESTIYPGQELMVPIS